VFLPFYHYPPGGRPLWIDVMSADVKKPAFYEQILNALGERIICVDSQTVIQWANTAACDAAGLALEDMVGRRYDDLPPVTVGIDTSRQETATHKSGDYCIVRSYPLQTADGRMGAVEIACEHYACEKEKEDIKQHLSREKFLADVSSRFTTVKSFDAALVAALEDLGMVTESDRAYTFTFRNNLHAMDNTHEWCAENVSAAKDMLQNLSTADFPWWMEQLTQGKAIHIPDVDTMPAAAENERRILKSQDIRSLIALPFFMYGTLGGFIGLDNVKRSAAWKPLDRNILRAAADIIGHAWESKQSWDALMQSEREYRALFDNSRSATVVIENDMLISLANAEFERLTGFSREEIEGKRTISSFADSEWARQLEAYHRLRRHKPSEAPKSYAFKLVDRTGNIKEVLTTVAMIPGTRRSVASMADTSPLKKTQHELEERRSYLEKVLNAVPDAIVTLDGNHCVVEWNPGAEKMFGYTQEEAAGKNLDDLVAKGNKYEEARGYTKRVLAGEELPPVETVRYRKDGTPVHVIASGSPIIIDNQLAGIVARYTDITDRKKAEEERRAFQNRLGQIQKMEAIGTLAGGIAHDFNNLLMGIQGRISLMIMDADTGHPFHEHLKQIQTIVKSGADLTKQLLGFARGGKYEVRATNVNEVLQKSARMFGRTKKEIRIHTKYEKDLWMVMADSGQLDQVLLNLFVNAWQAMPGGGDLYLSTRNVSVSAEDAAGFQVPPGDYVALAVTDTGVGMDEETQQRIFEPFFTTKDMGRGTGLGLASVYGIVKNHDGFVDVTSSPGEGTTFTLYLPGIKEPKQGGSSLVEQNLIVRGEGTILLVDDEEIIRDVGKEILEALGYSVITAPSGSEAISLYQKKGHDIDLVILDMIMPEMSGSVVLDALKNHDPSVSVLLSSGYNMMEDMDSMIDKGYKGFIQKPFTIEQLSQSVAKALS